MNTKIGPYQVVNLTPGRRVWINTLDLSWPLHSMYGLLEVDVTVARRLIAEHKARTGETLSFTSFLVSCLARAVDEDKAVQAYRKGRKQLILFDDVDVGLMVEHKDGDKRALMGHVIRAPITRPFGRFTTRFAQSNPHLRRRAEGCPPGSALPCCFRGRCPACSKFCSVARCVVTRRFSCQWEARLLLPLLECLAGVTAAGG